MTTVDAKLSSLLMVSLVSGIRVGVQLPEVEREVRWPEYVAMAQAAEEVGFDSMWAGDHLIYRDAGQPERGPWEAWTLLSALASVTSTIELGPLVACLGFHPPAVIAKMAANVDEVSNGRLILGVGAGWNQPEFTAFDIPFDRRGARFEEAFKIVQTLTSGERCTFLGDFNQVHDAVLLPTPLRSIPLMIGSIGERVLRASLPKVQWWNTWFDWYANNADGFDALNQRISKIATVVGRDDKTLLRSACLLVVTESSAGERPVPTDYHAATLGNVRQQIIELRDAGADEVILVSDPINEWSIRTLADVLR